MRNKELKKHIDTLQKFNEWRRDKHVPNSKEMPNPKEIGEAIDFIIEFAKWSDYTIRNFG